ncbi:MAG TPA: glycosyltransferase family 4 protein [Chitinophagaceae bacterium]|nr:glycosyltransferase family 4 protein [Chitinophagaceae bacterium]
MTGQGNSKKIIQHYLYSGLGGHGSVFFSLVGADNEPAFEYRAFFCGIEELREEYRNNCLRLNIPFTYLKKKRGLHLGAYFTVFRAFRKNRPDVIFLHGVGYSIIPALWYKITRPRTRLLVRDTQAHHLKSKMEWFWMFWCLLIAKRLVVLTEASANGIKNKFGWWAPSRKLVTISNGLDIEKYKPGNSRRNEGKFIIGMQSRLQPIKDHPTLLKAFKMIKDQLTGISVTLYIAGDGETMPAIKALVRELGIEKDVKLYGMLNEQELLSFMQSLDIYVHATFGETLSNSIMQAMASGLPVVASDVWGVNNMVQHAKNGFLYPSENAAELASWLKELLTNAALRKESGSNARKFAEDHYSNKVMFESYKKLYSN